jgi:NitT/TauT family transport system ATP-binding protein
MKQIKYLEVKNIKKVYHSIDGETLAINNIHFEINKGEFIGIIGPSGCGKSTILNIISGLDNNYSGKIIKKDNINIAYMLQEDALFPWLTILDNVLLGLKIRKKLNTISKNYALSLLKKYGLYSFKDKYPSSLSGGMKQRVACIL